MTEVNTMTSLLFVIMSQEQELALDDERRGYDEARQAVTVLERKRVALVTELDDVRALLEAVSISTTNCYGYSCRESAD
jgi:hypothetical protein